MQEREIQMTVRIVASEDKKNSYEIERVWDKELKKALVIELYPTISVEEPEKIDSSTMHLINHCRELKLGGVKIVNLYSSVIMSKPCLASDLKYDSANIAYIEDIFESDEIQNMEIIIAWGSSHSTHLDTINAKIDLLNLIRDKGLVNQTKCIVAGVVWEGIQGTHPLYLGLHHKRKSWILEAYDLDKALSELNAVIEEKNIRKVERKKTAKKTSKKEKKDVSDNTKPVGFEDIEERASEAG